ncbi:mitogen-activated protein kinase 11-like [Arapaima gigas]
MPSMLKAKMWYLTAFSLLLSDTLFTHTKSGCGNSEQWSTGSLQFFNVNKTWTDALKHCRDQNSTLVHIINDTVWENVTHLLRNQSVPHGVWVGLERSYLSCRGPWFWTGGPEVTSSKWYVNFTVTPPTNYCGKVLHNNTDTDTLLWHDACCEDRLPFICQTQTVVPA